MFKNLFAKYVSAFMGIILVSFLMIILVISSIIMGYSEDSKLEIMESAAHSSVLYLQEELSESDVNRLSEVVEREGDRLPAMLTSLASYTDDMTMIVTDELGRVILSVGNEATYVPVDSSVPIEWSSNVTKEGTLVSRLSDEPELFEKPHSVYAQSICDQNGTVRGSVLLCASSVLQTDLLKVLIKTIFHASLWILLASLIAIYLISEKVVHPLREISKAAKSFASGKFDVRVPVRGRDEVAELATAFNHMAESLNNYDEMRNTFMSNVSHDLRTPMTSIAGFIDGILDGVIPPEKHEYYLQLVSTEVKRLSRLVASLLDLSRIQAGERKFSMAPFDVCEMGREILISFEKKINEKHLDVSFECDEDKISVLADRDAIYQVFYNLCDNAVKVSLIEADHRFVIRIFGEEVQVNLRFVSIKLCVGRYADICLVSRQH